MNVKAFLTNKTVLYVVLFLAITNLLGYIALQDQQSVLFFIGSGVLTSFFSDNMVIILGTALIMTNLLKASDLRAVPVGAEGMAGRRTKGEDDEEETDDEETDDEETDGDETDDEETDGEDGGVDMPSLDEMMGELGSGSGSGSGSGFEGMGGMGGMGGMDRMISDMKAQDTASAKKKAANTEPFTSEKAGLREGLGIVGREFMNIMGLKKREGMRERMSKKKMGKKSGKGKKSGMKSGKGKKSGKGMSAEVSDGTGGKDQKGAFVDHASTVEAAYDNLESMIGKGGINGLTKETMSLMAKQQQLSKNMEGMLPLMKQAQQAISGFDISGLEKMSVATKGGKK